MDRDLKEVIAVFAVVISFGAGYFLSTAEHRDEIKTGQEFSAFTEVRKNTKELPDSIRGNQLAVEAAVNAYYQRLGDEYFAYTSDVLIEEVSNSANSSSMLTQNGFQIEATATGNILVTKVEEDSYAAQQGLMTGDEIIQIDDVVMNKVYFSEAVNALLGKSGTEFDMTVLRGNKQKKLHYVRNHEREIEQINDEYEQLGNICWIKYTGFYGEDAFFTEVHQTSDISSDGYIIDLRDNSGGRVDLCMRDLGCFIGNKLVGYRYYKNGEIVELNSEGEKRYDKPIVLLVNGETASAAEIFTAAMKQFYPNVTIVGETTFGKGITQEELRLENGEYLKYTSGDVTIGTWQCWQNIGIEPDKTVEMDSELIGTDEDIQLKAAIELLNGDSLD